MVKMKLPVPKDKHDLQSAKKLWDYSYEEIRPVVPELLGCLQDINWPIAKPVAEYLLSISDSITEEILAVLKTDDGMWKYWVLSVFGLEREELLDERIIQEIKRIVSQPTKDEVEDEVNLVAKEILDNLNGKG